MKPPRLVVLRALKIGDLVTAVPALRALARAYPMHERVLAAPDALRPLAGLLRSVDRVVDVAPLGVLPAILGDPAVAVNLHGKGPESTRVLAAARPERLIAFGCGERGCRVEGPRWRADEHEVERWCRLLSESGIDADPDDRRLAPPPVAPPPVAVGATIVHPGASAPARRWPADRFAAVARAEVDAGRRVVITGDPSERRLARQVADLAGLDDGVVLAGRTSLLELAAAVAAADVVCSGDTGVAHLATAFGTPSVVLFGPVSPAHWGPPAHDPRHRALWAGRLGDPHAPRVDSGLLHIGVDRVVATLGEVCGRKTNR
ncbi:MAG: glycosyl transferase, family 9 [Actinomycetia bacterium]|nr:glycosyl transferase, family 9 [Actinomycetes bacterium]